MKRFAVLFLCAVFLMIMSLSVSAESSGADPGFIRVGELSVGDTFYFGYTEQDDHDVTGLEHIEWQILDKLEDRMLVISKLGIDVRLYSSRFQTSGRYLWADSTIRAWLNGEFYETAFSERERTFILTSVVKNGADQSGYDVDGGPDTEDRLFLLSWAEVEQYFPAKEDRICFPTAYAIARGCNINEETGYCEWLLRSQGHPSLEGSVESVKTDLTHGYPWANSFKQEAIRPAMWLDSNAEVQTEPVNMGIQAEAGGGIVSLEALPSCEWEGYRLTPVYFRYADSHTDLRVRVACNGVPAALIFAHVEDFRLKAEPDTFGTAKAAKSMGRRLNGSENRNLQYFDLLFSPGIIGNNKDVDALSISFDDSDQVYPVCNGEHDSSLCAFQIQDGTYVVDLLSTKAADELWGKLKDQFNGADISLDLTKSFSETGFDTPTDVKFLESFDFASLRLTTGMDLSKYKKSDSLVELNMLDKPDKIPSLPNVRRFSFSLSENQKILPAFRNLPALEELDIRVFTAGKDDADILWLSSRPSVKSATLKTLNIYSDSGEMLPKDPDLRGWLTVQRMVTPDLQINGESADQYDFTEGLTDSDRKAVLQMVDDEAMLKLYEAFKQSSVPADAKAIPDGKIIVLVIKPHGGISCVSTDEAPEYSFDALPAGRMSSSLSEAGTLAVIYPVLEVTGRYGVIEAYRCTTCLELIDLNRQELISWEKIATRSPKSTITLGRDATHGDYEVGMALEKLAGKLE